MKTQNLSKLLLGFVSCLTLASLSSQAATLIAYDGFNEYTAGSGINGQIGGTGWSGAWAGIASATVASESITYSSAGITRGGGLSLKVTGNNNAAFGRNALPTLDQSGQSYFASFAFQVKSPNTGEVTGNPFASWMPRDSSIDINNDNQGFTGSSGRAGARIGGGNPPTSGTLVNSPLTGEKLQFNTTYFFVIEFGGWDVTEQRYTTSTVWLNPGTGDQFTTDASIKASSTAGTAVNGSDGFLGLNVRTVSLTADTYYLFDDLRVGTTWDSVVTQAIPEPSTTLLMGAFGAGLIVWRLRAR